VLDVGAGGEIVERRVGDRLPALGEEPEELGVAPPVEPVTRRLRQWHREDRVTQGGGRSSDGRPQNGVDTTAELATPAVAVYSIQRSFCAAVGAQSPGPLPAPAAAPVVVDDALGVVALAAYASAAAAIVATAPTDAGLGG
jgi:hypothetical protein